MEEVIRNLQASVFTYVPLPSARQVARSLTASQAQSLYAAQAAQTVADAAARRAGEKQDDITVAIFALGKAG